MISLRVFDTFDVCVLQQPTRPVRRFRFHDCMISLRVFDTLPGSEVAGGTIPGDSPGTELAYSLGPYVRLSAHP